MVISPKILASHTAAISPSSTAAACPLVWATAEPELAHKASATMILSLPGGMYPDCS